MSQYEFISYKPYPDDYSKVIITIRENVFDENGKPKPRLWNFARKDMKNGGVFYGAISQGVSKGDGSKEYIKGCEPELKGDAMQLQDFVDQCAKTYGFSLASVNKASDVPFIQRSNEVAANDELPF